MGGFVMKYEVNMNKTYKDINPVDEWGMYLHTEWENRCRI